MIGKVIRGANVAGLTRYLYGPGERNEHVDPHVVAGFHHPAALEPGIRPDGTRDLSKLNRLLNQPLAALPPGTADDKPVWHCALRAAPDDPILSDDAWADIAHQVMHHVGLAPYGDDRAVRWAAIRHADDHVHIVATLARQDGIKPSVWNDFRRLRAACNKAEQRYGLRGTAPADRTAAPRPTRAETELTHRQHRPEEPRLTLRRAVATAAATSANEAQFFSRLRAQGFLVRERFSTQTPGEITGYAVALPDHVNREGRPVWFGGGRLAPDLTLPKLRHRWAPATAPQCNATEAVEYAHGWLSATRPGDPSGHDTVWATADLLNTLTTTANGPGSRDLRRAADTYARAARPPHGRTPPHTPAGAALRGLARAIAATGDNDDRIQRAVAQLLHQLADLTDAISHLHAVNGRLIQADAAAAAAERLRHACSLVGQPTGEDASLRARHHTARPGRTATSRPPSAAAVAQRDFPCSPLAGTGPPTTSTNGPDLNRAGPQPYRGPRR